MTPIRSEFNVGKAWLIFLLLAVGFAFGEMQAHIKKTMWGYVWTLDPEPDFPMGVPGVSPSTQLVRCPNGDLTFGPWHVRVIYDEQAPFAAFLQERGH